MRGQPFQLNLPQVPNLREVVALTLFLHSWSTSGDCCRRATPIVKRA